MNRRTMLAVTIGAIWLATAGPALAQAKPESRPPTAPLDLNTASIQELQGLPGVGPRTAERILEYREQRGRFEKIEDLMNVRGIGEKSFLKLRALVVVTPPKSKSAGS
jgi:competence protein ComEA